MLKTMVEVEQRYLIYNNMLESCYNTQGLTEAGCDEAGRGCLDGSEYAAAVITFAGAEIRHPHHARDAADGGAPALAVSGVREGLPRGREFKQHLRVESRYVRLTVRYARSARVL